MASPADLPRVRQWPTNTRVIVTLHAAERFQQRWAPGFRLDACRREIQTLASAAVHLRQRTHAGQEQWQASDGSGMVFVVKRDPGQREPVCVTVLPAPEAEIDDISAPELEPTWAD